MTAIDKMARLGVVKQFRKDVREGSVSWQRTIVHILRAWLTSVIQRNSDDSESGSVRLAVLAGAAVPVYVDI